MKSIIRSGPRRSAERLGDLRRVARPSIGEPGSTTSRPIRVWIDEVVPGLDVGVGALPGGDRGEPQHDLPLVRPAV